MREILYIDEYFFLNFLMDLAALFLTARILSEKAPALRLAAAAALGGALGAVPILFSFSGWATALFALVSFPLLPLCAFGYRGKRRFFFAALFAFAGSLFLGGAVEAVYFFTARFSAQRKITLLVFLFALALGLTFWECWGRGMKRRLDTHVVLLTLNRGERKLSVYGLVDSGCLLKEPVSGDPVVLIKASQADPLFSPEELALLSRGTLPGTLALPMRSTGGAGVLFGFRPDKAFLHHKSFKKEYKSARCVVAVDFSEGAFAGCPALIPLSLI